MFYTCLSGVSFNEENVYNIQNFELFFAEDIQLLCCRMLTCFLLSGAKISMLVINDSTSRYHIWTCLIFFATATYKQHCENKKHRCEECQDGRLVCHNDTSSSAYIRHPSSDSTRLGK